MAHIEASLRNILISATAVVSVYGSAVYCIEAPQEQADPYAVLTIVSDPVSPLAFGAYVNARAPRVQIDSYSQSSVTCIEGAEAILSALRGYQGSASGIQIELITVDNIRQLREPDTGWFHSAVDVIVEYVEA